MCDWEPRICRCCTGGEKGSSESRQEAIKAFSPNFLANFQFKKSEERFQAFAAMIVWRIINLSHNNHKEGLLEGLRTKWKSLVHACSVEKFSTVCLLPELCYQQRVVVRSAARVKIRSVKFSEAFLIFN